MNNKQIVYDLIFFISEVLFLFSWISPAWASVGTLLVTLIFATVRLNFEGNEKGSTFPKLEEATEYQKFFMGLYILELFAFFFISPILLMANMYHFSNRKGPEKTMKFLAFILLLIVLYQIMKSGFITKEIIQSHIITKGNLNHLLIFVQLPISF